MRKQSKFALLLAIHVGVAVIVLFGGMLFLFRSMSIYQEVSGQRKVLNDERDKIKAELATRREKTAELAKLETDLSSLDQDLVDYKYIPTFLEQIQAASQHTGNMLRNLQPRAMRPLVLESSPLMRAITPPKPADTTATAPPADTPDAGGSAKSEPPKPAFQIQQLGMTLDGDYPSVLQFLDALRHFRKMVFVRSMTLSPNANTVNAKPGMVTANIDAYLIIIPNQYRDESQMAHGPEMSLVAPLGRASRTTPMVKGGAQP